MKRLFICLMAILMIAGCAPQVPEETTVADETQPAQPSMVGIDGSYSIIFTNSDASYNAAYTFQGFTPRLRALRSK